MTDTPPPLLPTRLVDVRQVPLDALKARALIDADELSAPENKTPLKVAAFNASL